jgi:hypothetical protein
MGDEEDVQSTEDSQLENIEDVVGSPAASRSKETGWLGIAFVLLLSGNVLSYEFTKNDLRAGYSRDEIEYNQAWDNSTSWGRMRNPASVLLAPGREIAYFFHGEE